MICPFCQDQTKVIDSRLIKDGHAVRRRRKCLACAFRFSSVEELRILDLIVVKRDGRHEPYQREKIEKGLRLALRKRSYTGEEFEHLLRCVELEIYSQKLAEITSLRVGEILMDKLRDFDKVAYIRFASVYRQFSDVQTFQKELKALQND